MEVFNGTNVTVESKGSNYFTSTFYGCFLTSFSVTFSSSNTMYFDLNTMTGKVTVIALSETYIYTIKACAGGSIDDADCVTSSS